MRKRTRSTMDCGYINTLRGQLLGVYADTFEDLADRDGRKCATCGTTNKLCIDHIVPLSRGGSNDMKNLQLLCRNCNSRKSNGMPGDVPMGIRGDKLPLVTFMAPVALVERFDKVAAIRYTNRSVLLRELMAREVDAFLRSEQEKETEPKEA